MTHVVFEREPGARADTPPFTMPKPIGRMLVALAVLTICVAGAARYFGFTAPVQPLAPVVAARALVMRDRADRGVEIVDAADGRVLSQFSSEDDARFLRTVLRSLGGHVDPRDSVLAIAFTIAMREDGQLTVSRRGSERTAAVNGFGQAQVAKLQELLVKR